MKIRINGADADIQLETEKTVGEILGALDSWLSGTGHRLSGISVNGEPVHADSMETCFARAVETVQTLDIQTNSLPELLAEGLLNIIHDIEAWENTGFDEKSAFISHWEISPEAVLFKEQFPDLYETITKTFSGEGSGPQLLRTLIIERFNELQDPAGELSKAGTVVTEICARLEELPLDIQTGKDARAAETVNVFSVVTEKVFRVFNILKLEGFPVGEIMVDDMPITAYIAEFGTALRELLAAYEQHDTVLVGDLAEYEMAPRLRGLHNAVLGVIGGE